MTITERINSFEQLGEALSALTSGEKQSLYFSAESKNNWFNESSIESALAGIIKFLDRETLSTWAAQYEISESFSDKKIGLVMAGNIPMVGFHDLLCVLMAGHIALTKLSSQDEVLIKFLISMLRQISPEFADRVVFAERLNDADAFVATGSDNTARYFHYYFGKKDHIIRKNRSSVAVIDGAETEEELKALGIDIFTYWGLGCRNVSKVLVPEGYDFIPLLDALAPYEYVADHHKYNNNYDYNKSILLVNRVPHLDTGFLLVQESENLVSPISVLFYQTYKDQNDLEAYLKAQEDKIQCIVGHDRIPFGGAQYPSINDYADGVDTMQFLTGLQ